MLFETNCYSFEQIPSCSNYFSQSTGSIQYPMEFFNINQDPNGNHFDGIQLPRRRRDDTNVIINKLYDATLMRRAGERDLLRLGGRKNKNEILGLTNARLIKEKHLHGNKYSRELELTRGLPAPGNNGEFLLLLRTDGRIVAMSDEVEQHLSKTMRSLYTQCINIFACLDQVDGDKLRTILTNSTDSFDQEYQLVCTLRLPKGKRPSRTREDVKTISITGHFYSCHDSCHDRLFLARCEALVSCQVNGSNSSTANSTVNNTMMKFILNDDMTINIISSNVKDFLGYSRNEMIGHWLGRFLASEDLEKFEQLRQNFLHADQIMASNHCELFDFYTNHGDHRLTFLCQIRPTRERRSKSIKYNIIAQMIDPSMRAEYAKYISNETFNPLTIPIKMEPHVHQMSPKINEDHIKADSPSLAMGLLMLENEPTSNSSSRQSSPSHRSLSNGVAPFVFDDVDEDFQGVNYQYQTPNNDDFLIKTYWADDFASIDALMNDI